MRMSLDIIKPVPVLNCVACDKELAVTQIKLNSSVAILLCETCLYELERLFYRRVSADLDAIENFGHNSKYSEVVIKLTFCRFEGQGNAIDYTIEATEENGNSIHIDSDIMQELPLGFVISEIAKTVSDEKRTLNGMDKGRMAQ